MSQNQNLSLALHQNQALPKNLKNHVTEAMEIKHKVTIVFIHLIEFKEDTMITINTKKEMRNTKTLNFLYKMPSDGTINLMQETQDLAHMRGKLTGKE